VVDSTGLGCRLQHRAALARAPVSISGHVCQADFRNAGTWLSESSRACSFHAFELFEDGVGGRRNCALTSVATQFSELDHLLAMHFGWWDVIVENK
jgi:hypothetical protein